MLAVEEVELELDELELELDEELFGELLLLNSQRFVTPGSGSAKLVVLQRIPPLTASTSLAVHEVFRPKRTLRLPVKEHKSPSFAQNVQVSMDWDELELLLELDELDTELELDEPVFAEPEIT